MNLVMEELGFQQQQKQDEQEEGSKKPSKCFASLMLAKYKLILLILFCIVFLSGLNVFEIIVSDKKWSEFVLSVIQNETISRNIKEM